MLANGDKVNTGGQRRDDRLHAQVVTNTHPENGDSMYCFNTPLQRTKLVEGTNTVHEDHRHETLREGKNACIDDVTMEGAKILVGDQDSEHCVQGSRVYCYGAGSDRVSVHRVGTGLLSTSRRADAFFTPNETLPRRSLRSGATSFSREDARTTDAHQGRDVVDGDAESLVSRPALR